MSVAPSVGGPTRPRGLPAVSFTTLASLLVLAAAAALGVVSPASAKGIYATVQAPWTETSLMQEGCEWAAQTLGAAGFYDCLEALDGHGDGARAVRPAQQYELLTSHVLGAWSASGPDSRVWGSDAVSAGHCALFEVEMAARLYSPAVEAHYTLAEEAIRSMARDGKDVRSVCASGKAFTVMQRPKDLSNKAIGVVPQLDHVHPLSADVSPASPSDAPVLAVLYGLVGEPDTMALYRDLVKRMRENSSCGSEPTALIFRHLPLSRARICQATVTDKGGEASVTSAASAAAEEERHSDLWSARLLRVQGYGATVDFKSVEYKVIDERGAKAAKDAQQVKAAGAAADRDGEALLTDTAGGGQVGGFDIGALKARYPDLGVQLDSFTSAMEDALGSVETKVDLDAVESQNIGIAAAQYVQDAKPEERLAVLADLVTRFPSYAARLSKLATHSSRLASLQRQVEAQPFPGISDGGATMFINGVQLPERDLSLFGALRMLRLEEEFKGTLRSVLTARTPAAQAASGDAEAPARHVPVDEGGSAVAEMEATIEETVKLLEHDTQANPVKARRLKIPLGVVCWLNNVETDPMLERLPAAMSTAHLHSADGRPLLPRRNILHIIAVADADSRSVWAVLAQLSRYAHGGLIARFGVAMYDPAWKDTVAGDATDSAFARVVSPGPGSAAEGPSPSLVPMLISVALREASSGGDYSRAEALVQQLSVYAQQAELTPEVVLAAATATSIFDEDITIKEVLEDGEFQAFYMRQQSVIRAAGLANPAVVLPAVFVNGLRVSLQDLLRGTIAMVVDEMTVVRDLIAAGALTDSTTDCYEAALQHLGAGSRLQSAFDGQRQRTFAYDSPELLDWLYTQPFLYPMESSDDRAAQVNDKAPYVVSSTVTTSVVLLPSDARLGDVGPLLASTLAAHETTPVAPEEAGSAKKSQKRPLSAKSGGGRAGDDVTLDEIEAQGAARLTVVFSDAVPANARRGSVQQSIEALLRFDAAAMSKSGRHSSLLSSYVGWVLSALEVDVSGATASLQFNDPSSDLALAKVLPLPSAVEQALRDPASVATPATDASNTLRRAVRRQLPDGGDAGAGLHPLLLINSRAFTFLEPEGVAADDIVSALVSAARTASITARQLAKMRFTELSPESSLGFTADDLDAGFFAGKSVAFESIVLTRMRRPSVSPAAAAVGVPEPLREAVVLPPVEEAGDLGFTTGPVAAAGLKSGATAAKARHRVTIVVDPTARKSQLIVALAEFLAKSPLGVSVTVYLNPSLQVTRPIRALFTFVASPALQFDSATGMVVPPVAVFRALPANALLTLGIEEPESWTVFSHEADHDLDNIILAALPKHRQFVSATYRINSILVAGSALTLIGNQGQAMTSNGLPLLLRPLSPSPAATGKRTDTLVMETLGYYQLQAAPGLFHLSVQPGAFASAYYISGIDSDIDRYAQDYAADPTTGGTREGVNAAAGQRIPVLVSTFTGLSLDLYVRPVPSPQGQLPVLDIAQRIAREGRYVWPPPSLPDGSKDRPARPAKPTLNVFSVASGHLYERFLRRMMFSAWNASTRTEPYGANTTRIKFWVIENFLSPQFKAYIPLMAEHFGYEVGFVTYHWPWWLHRQTEKQRKIWAYKVLFLDVLFPLDVDRVIFVDADQTINVDLHELYNMDIDDKPVAMTPFCQKHRNEATVGFRFWAQGFWTEHLAGKPYHISALFMVDLSRFRALGAGDSYRTTYSTLSRDPNSLSNLDQDLPNYLQSTVPIFSLPEEWLWCESWCSAGSRGRAKTIDLCNNPLTKMPKLDNAKMIFPDWEDLDNVLEAVAGNVTDAAAQRGFN